MKRFSNDEWPPDITDYEGVCESCEKKRPLANDICLSCAREDYFAVYDSKTGGYNVPK